MYIEREIADTHNRIGNNVKVLQYHRFFIVFIRFYLLLFLSFSSKMWMENTELRVLNVLIIHPASIAFEHFLLLVFQYLFPIPFPLMVLQTILWLFCSLNFPYLISSRSTHIFPSPYSKTVRKENEWKIFHKNLYKMFAIIELTRGAPHEEYK